MGSYCELVSGILGDCANMGEIIDQFGLSGEKQGQEDANQDVLVTDWNDFGESIYQYDLLAILELDVQSRDCIGRNGFNDCAQFAGICETIDFDVQLSITIIVIAEFEKKNSIEAIVTIEDEEDANNGMSLSINVMTKVVKSLIDEYPI
ncbi:MAG: hypothetical protein EZS28_012856 [Streblomastix strix]|uniref:Uncharacterized protein n=1 Tax=Streblomastix strix TaxID=222440 RepID=A0A5J4WAS2_9EUKA|nr:MAG: hypothetical protein EZS28_012856 [Streblomastix strix]